MIFSLCEFCLNMYNCIYRGTKSMNRNEILKILEEGCHKFSVGDKKYHGTLCKFYLPVLDTNRSEMRKNETSTSTITFFDLNENIWVTLNFEVMYD
ncbi:hypothetical protein VPFG_00040 [Vibrio phage nt-1]|uniref:Uncharacterized protein n=1 Tax=Vibrio phage nt-1 TaxID=115992 RepID=R9TI81_9CAUD|nr:hypothetical protein VPFG_00040 [Vibrio phage nt-1]AGN30045.2 hypothetical protein VPFG_00040 [Vibrio phage nt-1]